MDDSLPKIQIVKKSATTALSDLKNNPSGAPAPSSVTKGKENLKQVSEYVSEVPQNVELDAELKEHGIEAVSETVELPDELKKHGVESVDIESVYAPPKENLIGQVPLTTAAMQKGLHAKVADSILWLVYWCMRQIQLSRFSERKNKIL